MQSYTYQMTMIAFLVAVVLVALSGYCSSSSSTMILQRAEPYRHQNMGAARLRDVQRKKQLVGDYNLSGGFSTTQIYFTKIRLGSPPQEFHVLVDTGSDLLWVSCVSCSSCPRTSSLGFDLHFYNASESSTASLVSCSDRKQCSGCRRENQCEFEISYGEGSQTTGTYVTDLLHIPQIKGSSQNSSFPVTFGCSTERTKQLATRPFDGIIGFGSNPDSVLTQLSSQGIIPSVFSHCLSGDDTGGGILTLGEMVSTEMVFTPLIPHQFHYNVELLSISVDSKKLPISSDALRTKTSQGIAFDSGTTFSYLAEEVFDPFITAINTYVSKHATPHPIDGELCYDSATSGTSFYPQVTLTFAGDANLVLKPEDYLYPLSTSPDGSIKWCMGFHKIPNGDISILGELVLRDKIVTYDLYKHQIGWSPYFNCSSSFKVNSTYGFTNGQTKIKLWSILLIAGFFLLLSFMVILFAPW